MAKQVGWAIIGRWGIYTGWHYTRRKAIRAHVHNFGYDPNDPRHWQRFRRLGDRAVRVKISAIDS